MKFFIDGANLSEIREFAEMGMVDGVTTNPSIIAKSGGKIHEIIREICSMVSGPVSAEVVAEDLEGMLKEASFLTKIASNVAIKVPLTPDGLKACYLLRKDGIMVNVTLCFSPAQALLAAKAGATFISPFIGRLDDVGTSGMELLQSICHIYENYLNIETQVLAASIRHPQHVVEAAQIGADIVTAPVSVYRQLFKHPLTDIGIKTFLADWKTTGQSIIS
jgi:transaldolase